MWWNSTRENKLQIKNIAKVANVFSFSKQSNYDYIYFLAPFFGHLLDRRQWTMAHIKGIQPERLYIITMVLIPRPSGRHINDILIYSI